jgi:DNA-binding LacI/PurR family transcriptional regulator
VAALAGVSPATASRVLNGTAKVSGPVRAGVREAMTQLSYVPQRVRGPQGARGSQRDAVRSIAAVVWDDGVRLFADSFFARVLRGAGQALRHDEIQLVLLLVRDPADYPSVERYLSRGLADGVIMISAHGRDPLCRSLSTLGLPTVLAGRPTFPADLPYVDADNRGGAREAVRRLLRSGRRSITSIAGPPDMAVGVDRLAGYRDVLAEAGMPSLILHGDFSQASGEHAMTRLLACQPDLDAVFAASDLMASGALRTLRRAGRRVPEDVAVIGFDDAPLALHTDPRLTTVRQPVEEMGAAMARLLTRQIVGEPAEAGEAAEPVGTVFATELIVRESG